MLVTVERLTKTYGKFTAVDDVSFVVHAGEIAGLVGPNGAGKTTLFDCLSGVRTPTSGTIILDGVDVTEFNLKSLRRQIAMVLQPPLIFPISVRDNLAGDSWSSDDFRSYVRTPWGSRI